MVSAVKTYAHVSDTIVVELIQTDADISEMFHPDLMWVECSDEVTAGWGFGDGVFTPPPAPPAPSKSELIAYAASERYRKEIGGVSFSGVPIATDDRSKQMILGARVAATADPEFVTNWVAADGSIVQLDATSIVALSNAVLAHVDGCFATFAAVVAEINAGAMQAVEQVEDAFAG